MPNRKIYVVGASYSYTNWMQGSLVDNMEDADLICYSGGEDLSPHLYGKFSHPTTYANEYRDQREQEAFKKAVSLGKKIIGICRGSQLVCALSGGILVQDQDNPRYLHKIETYDGKELIVNSTHHQAAYPWGLPADEFKLLGWSKNISPYHYGQCDEEELVSGIVDGGKECEVVFYPKTKALGIQFHPELLFDGPYSREKSITDTIDWCRGLLDKHIAGEL